MSEPSDGWEREETATSAGDVSTDTADVRLESLPTAELAALVRRALTLIASRADQESLAALVDLQTHAGVSLGEAARGVAANGSWTQVGELMGTTKQAAWSRWREA